MLLELLAALDFVESVKASHTEAAAESQDEPPDFFALAGLWQDRETTLDSIREKAWPRSCRGGKFSAPTRHPIDLKS